MFSRREILSSGIALSVSACSRDLKLDAPIPNKKRLTIDGLSFLRGDPEDLMNSGLDAAIIDVSKYSIVTKPDGLSRVARTFEDCDESISAIPAQVVTSYPSAFIAKKGSEIYNDNRIALFLQFQSCEPIGDDLNRISYFYNKGLRILQLTHHTNNLFAGGALEAEQSGLTPLGREGVSEMNRTGILPDVSHASDQTLFETVETSSGPVILSHGACRAIVNNPRCASDDMIRAIADSGGVIGVFMMSFWLTQGNEPRAEHYLSHFKHLANIGGMESVAISNDFALSGQQELVALKNDNTEGVKAYHDWWMSVNKRGVYGFETLPQHVVIPEFNNINRMSLIEKALESDSFFKSTDIDKIMGANWARVLSEALI